MGGYKYIRKILNFYGKGKHKYVYKGKAITKSSARRVQKVMKHRTQKGSYFEKSKGIKTGDRVYFRTGLGGTHVRSGKVTRVDQIYHGRDQAASITTKAGKSYRIQSGEIYDHKPRKVVRRDEYGKVTTWE